MLLTALVNKPNNKTKMKTIIPNRIDKAKEYILTNMKQIKITNNLYNRIIKSYPIAQPEKCIELISQLKTEIFLYNK